MDSDDLIIWSDGTWCYRCELFEMSHMSDDYVVVTVRELDYDDVRDRLTRGRQYQSCDTSLLSPSSPPSLECSDMSNLMRKPKAELVAHIQTLTAELVVLRAERSVRSAAPAPAHKATLTWDERAEFFAAFPNALSVTAGQYHAWKASAPSSH